MIADGGLQSLDIGLQVIRALNSRDRLTVRAVATLTGASVSASHRSLKTLENRGFVTLSSSGRGYVPGPSLLALQMTPTIQQRNKASLRPLLQAVREATGESVHAATLLGNQVLVIDGRNSKFASDIGLRIGMTAPAYAMAAGKLLLSQLDSSQVMALLPQESLPRRGPGTLTSRALLMEQLVEINKAKIAFTYQESEAGINSFAVPMTGNTWRDRVALVVSVPVSRGRKSRLLELAEVVQNIVGAAQVQNKSRIG